MKQGFTSAISFLSRLSALGLCLLLMNGCPLSKTGSDSGSGSSAHSVQAPSNLRLKALYRDASAQANTSDSSAQSGITVASSSYYQIVVSFDPPNGGADGYRLAYAEETISGLTCVTKGASLVSGPKPSFTLDVYPDTVYTIAVCAYDSSGNSDSVVETIRSLPNLPPLNVSVTSIVSNTIHVSFDPAKGKVAGYEVSYAQGTLPELTCTYPGSVQSDLKTALSSDLYTLPGTPYTVAVCSYDGNGHYSQSVVEYVTTPSDIAAPSISFSGPIAATVGVAFSTVVPANSGGAISACTVAPPLPSGLSLSETDCEISGTPSASSAAQTFSVTATNPGGSNVATVSITVAAPVVTPSSSVTVANSGFETPDMTSTAGASPNNWGIPSGSGWTFTANSGIAGIAGNGSAFTTSNPSAVEGTQVGFIKLDASISQNINFSAGTYNVSFNMAQRAVANTEDQSISIKIDGNPIGSATAPSTSYQTYTSPGFTVTAGQHTLSFAGLTTSGDSTAFIDKVRIQPQSVTPMLANCLSASPSTVLNHYWTTLTLTPPDSSAISALLVNGFSVPVTQMQTDVFVNQTDDGSSSTLTFSATVITAAGASICNASVNVVSMGNCYERYVAGEAPTAQSKVIHFWPGGAQTPVVEDSTNASNFVWDRVEPALQLFTGNRLVLWGGIFYGTPNNSYGLHSATAVLNKGIVTDIPASPTSAGAWNNWTETSQTGAYPATAWMGFSAWTGTEVLVGSGFDPLMCYLNGSLTGGSTCPNQGTAYQSAALFNPSTNSWRAAAPIPAYASYISTSTFQNGKLYVINSFNAPVVSGGIYDVASDTWTPMPSAGAPAISGNNASTVFDGSRFILNIVDDDGGLYSSHFVYHMGVYDIPTNKWSAFPNTPTCAWYHSVSVPSINKSFLYCALSSTASGSLSYVGDAYLLDSVTGLKKVSSPTTPVQSAPNGPINVIDIKGKILAIGSTVQLYDPATDQWTVLASSPTNYLGAGFWMGSKLVLWFDTDRYHNGQSYFRAAFDSNTLQWTNLGQGGGYYSVYDEYSYLANQPLLIQPNNNLNYNNSSTGQGWPNAVYVMSPGATAAEAGEDPNKYGVSQLVLGQPLSRH